MFTQDDTTLPYQTDVQVPFISWYTLLQRFTTVDIKVDVYSTLKKRRQDFEADNFYEEVRLETHVFGENGYD